MEGGSQVHDHGQAIYAKIRYCVSQVLLQLVVKAGITCEVKHLNLSSVPSYWWYLERYFFVKVHLHSSWIFMKIMPFTPPKTKKKSFDFFTLKRSLPKLFQLFFSGLWFPFIMYRSNRSFNMPPPRATPRAFDFFENYCSNSPLPGPKCRSNAPH